MKFWQSINLISILLLPFSALYFVLSSLDIFIKKKKGRKALRNTNNKVLVVGNITAGGTGKTPFIQMLAKYLLEQNLKVAIVARGYGAHPPQEPFIVLPNSSAIQSGDEALTHAQYLNIPVVIAKQRMLAINKVNECFDVDVILSDDGLQHWQMPRDINIVLVDGLRGFGNQCFLPAGPLRQRQKFLKQADFVLCKGKKAHRTLNENIESFNIKCLGFFDQNDNEVDITQLKNLTLVSAIANPNSFYQVVNQFVTLYETKEFKDHHSYTEQDFESLQGNILMTQKDFVKCKNLNLGREVEGVYYCKIEANMDEKLLASIKDLIMN